MPDPSFSAWRVRIEAVLDRTLAPATDSPQHLHAAMRHAVLDGGKRMRPMLVYATGTAFGASETDLDAPAAAVELIHAYSLVHDDLPAMDDDSLRRGKPTVHVAFDEATAILAGDALQSLAFELLADAPLAPAGRLAMLRELAIASGARGMCGGQALDIAATGATDALRIDELQRLHALKTGALLRASVRLGAIVAAVDADTMHRLDQFGDALGLAFQIRDDLLDLEGDSATLGKTAGKDAAQAKATFPSLIGVEASRSRLRELAGTMHDALAPLAPRAGKLEALAHQVIQRVR
ncbi:MAG TPA: farnesyl diphosphate synthase [Lysobacter sp.]|nr:farnesyl diphosphate synthase [Lysobacter sp.]